MFNNTVMTYIYIYWYYQFTLLTQVIENEGDNVPEVSLRMFDLVYKQYSYLDFLSKNV